MDKNWRMENQASSFRSTNRNRKDDQVGWGGGESFVQLFEFIIIPKDV